MDQDVQEAVHETRHIHLRHATDPGHAFERVLQGDLYNSRRDTTAASPRISPRRTPRRHRPFRSTTASRSNSNSTALETAKATEEAEKLATTDAKPRRTASPSTSRTSTSFKTRTWSQEPLCAGKTAHADPRWNARRRSRRTAAHLETSVHKSVPGLRLTFYVLWT